MREDRMCPESLKNALVEEVLPAVKKPGRYIGNEINISRKSHNGRTVKFLLCFPDVYDIGMSHLGIKILYSLLNSREDVACERAFAPWVDAEEKMRSAGIPLYSLETFTPAARFEIIGFSLQYEMTYTNVVNMLDLAGVPKFSHQRQADDPVVIGGGPLAFCAEPVADFFDAFVVGDGEDVVPEIVEIYRKLSKPAGNGRKLDSREGFLHEIGGLEGVYVPSDYAPCCGEDGAYSGLYDRGGVPCRIRRRVVRDLDAARYPVDQIVPLVQVIHDRLSIEIMRGCPVGCKFCQASAIYGRKRERSVENIVELCERAYANTGYDEISLMSLSTGSYSNIERLLSELNKRFGKENVLISLPSLRIETVEKMMPFFGDRKKTGLTLAPEAASDRLLASIGKRFEVRDLLDLLAKVYREGYRRIKLYFMIGLPTETDEDVKLIPELLNRASYLRRDVSGRPAEVVASISSFIPKPHTSFQREGMCGALSLASKQKTILNGIDRRFVKADFHDIGLSLLECALARGGRELSKVVYDAWESGCRFDGWTECFRGGNWQKAFEKNGCDIEQLAVKAYSAGEKLAWEHITLEHAVD